ncbi:hypothetical protein BY996DRAFT_6426441 [Phakopsora pachyrhizi]|uniref:Expressed protein n=1 Tax=Phakopsora pachyrhizi TaxID=170000 RepID=A0AAV0BVK4_PHAPC|nr:hypothetical protein BY996DRAFT_6426441 [Phakopsora pachyrhizi]CAH7690813.1 expressed protein [Phakopsora pachyrhizi]
MAIVSFAIIFYLTHLTKYSQGTRNSIDLLDKAPTHFQTEFGSAVTSLDPLILSGTPDKNWLSLGLSAAGDQTKTETVQKSTENIYLSSNEKGERSYLGEDLKHRQQLNDPRTFRHSNKKSRATEISAKSLARWPIRSDGNELSPIGTDPGIIGQSAQTKISGSMFPGEYFGLCDFSEPSKTEAEPATYQISQSGTMNFFPKLTTHWGLKNGEIHPGFQIYDPKTYHLRNNIRNEIDVSFHPSAPKDKNHGRTEDTTIMPLDQMYGENSQEVKNSPDLRSKFQPRLKEVNLDLSLAPSMHKPNPLYLLGDTGQVMNDEVGGSIKSFENNQRKGKRKVNVADAELTNENSRCKTEKKKSYDTKLSESDFGFNGDKEVVTMSHTIMTFEDALMELLDPAKLLIQSDLFEKYIIRAEKLKEDIMKTSITNVLNSIIKRYSKYEREYFYITDSEVRDFLKVQKFQGFKLTPHTNDKINSQNFERMFFTEIRTVIEALNFENLVKSFIKVHGVNFFSISVGDPLSNFHFRRNSYIKKLFLVYSILINKIFCGESTDESFVNKQKSSIEFYGSVFRNIKPDKDGNYHIGTDAFQNIDEALRIKVGLDKKILSFNKSAVNIKQNQERIQYRMAWILIELWLAFYRPDLFDKLSHGTIIRDSFKPFLNTLIKINWQIFK